MKKESIIDGLLNDTSSSFRMKVSRKLIDGGFRPPFKLKRVGHFNRNALGVLRRNGSNCRFAHSLVDGVIRVYALDEGRVSIFRRSFKNKELAEAFIDELTEVIIDGGELDNSKWDRQNFKK